MRKIFLLSTLFLLACSVSSLPFLPQAAPTTSTQTPIPFPTETSTPAIPLTYTFTPTMIGAVPTATFTITPLPTETFFYLTPPTETFTPPPTSAFTPTVSLVGTGFNWVNLSADVIHWGACEPHTVTITAELTSPAEVHSVEIFVRFRDKASGVAAGWDRGTTLDKQADGSFSITLDSRGMTTYTNAWIVYQLVATNTSTHYVVRTPVFADQLTLSACP